MKKICYIIVGFLCLFYEIGGIFFHDNIYAISNGTTNIKLSIYNSYSGHIRFLPGQNIVNIGGSLWTNDDSLSINISATTGSSFTINGDIITPIAGNGIGLYSIAESLELSTGDGIKNIQTSFMKGTEPYTHHTSITVDTISPTQANLISPDNNSTVSGNVIFTRSQSTDSGIGLSHYKIHYSVDPGFLSETTIVSSGNTLQIAENNIPLGILYRYVESVDLLGNNTNSVVKLFEHALGAVVVNPINTTPSSGIGGGSSQKIYPTNTTGEIIINNTGNNLTISGNNLATSGIINETVIGDIINNNTGNNPTISGTIDSNIDGVIKIDKKIIPLSDGTGNLYNTGGKNDTQEIVIIDKEEIVVSEKPINQSEGEYYDIKQTDEKQNVCNLLSYKKICTTITNSKIYNEIITNRPYTKDVIDTIFIEYDSFITNIIGENTINENIINENYKENIINENNELLAPITYTIDDFLKPLYSIFKSIDRGWELVLQLYKKTYLQ